MPVDRLCKAVLDDSCKLWFGFRDSVWWNLLRRWVRIGPEFGARYCQSEWCWRRSCRCWTGFTGGGGRKGSSWFTGTGTMESWIWSLSVNIFRLVGVRWRDNSNEASFFIRCLYISFSSILCPIYSQSYTSQDSDPIFIEISWIPSHEWIEASIICPIATRYFWMWHAFTKKMFSPTDSESEPCRSWYIWMTLHRHVCLEAFSKWFGETWILSSQVYQYRDAILGYPLAFLLAY